MVVAVTTKYKLSTLYMPISAGDARIRTLKYVPMSVGDVKISDGVNWPWWRINADRKWNCNGILKIAPKTKSSKRWFSKPPQRTLLMYW